MDEVRRAALTAANVLVRGEPGTGKELVARAIHVEQHASREAVREDRLRRAVDRRGHQALPQTLALAIGGTLFLDEVGALSSDMQTRLLAALPTSPANRAPLNVRIIASTNRDLFRKVREGEFRESLYDRLTMLAIDIPPLRARVEDIPLLVQDIVHKAARRMGRRAQASIRNRCPNSSNYAWPGNIRELANLVERALVMQDAPVLKITTDFLGTTAPVERAALVAAAGDRRHHAHHARRPGGFRRHAEHRTARRAARPHPARARRHALGHRRQSRRGAQARPQARNPAPPYEEAGDLARRECGPAGTAAKAEARSKARLALAIRPTA